MSYNEKTYLVQMLVFFVEIKNDSFRRCFVVEDAGGTLWKTNIGVFFHQGNLNFVTKIGTIQLCFLHFIHTSLYVSICPLTKLFSRILFDHWCYFPCRQPKKDIQQEKQRHQTGLTMAPYWRSRQSKGERYCWCFLGISNGKHGEKRTA